MARVFNFSAGPATLPEEVLKTAQQEMFDWHGIGMGVMEMSHRTPAFEEILHTAENDLRDLMGIPSNYKVLFLQGGGWQQFSAVPMNMVKNGKADYIVTGIWSKKAAQEAEKYLTVNRVASGADKNFTYIPDCSDLAIDEDADYVYICQNNTLFGTRYPKLPNTKGKVLVSDVSSMFLSEPIPVEKYGVIYAGVQKNAGPAGLVTAIIREDLIRDDVPDYVPTMLKWKTQADNDSLFNTPNCWAIYVCGLVFKWLKGLGGLEVMKEMNEKKAGLLYDFLDQSRMFHGTAEKDSRSLMNVPFITDSEELNKAFITLAEERGLKNIKGHRLVGGMRASIYNAMPYEGVEKLVQFMDDFEHGKR